MCGGSPRHIGVSILFDSLGEICVSCRGDSQVGEILYTLVLPSLNRNTRWNTNNQCNYMSGRLHRVASIFLLSFSPLFYPRRVLFYSDVGELHRVVFFYQLSFSPLFFYPIFYTPFLVTFLPPQFYHGLPTVVWYA